MGNGKDALLMEIRELRARAAGLTGNEYYMTTQALDALVFDTEMSEDVMREALVPIAAQFAGAASAETVPVTAATDAPGGPDIPPPPDSPAEPDYSPTPEVPEVPDSPTDPDLVPTPEIPPSPASPPNLTLQPHRRLEWPPLLRL